MVTVSVKLNFHDSCFNMYLLLFMVPLNRTHSDTNRYEETNNVAYQAKTKHMHTEPVRSVFVVNILYNGLKIRIRLGSEPG